MAAIIPRWEWRTFGSRFGIAESRFAELTPTSVQESDELYLLAGTGDNVKIRDALMDIKVLREVGADGLERWEPVMKQGFPLGAADMRNVFASLNLAAPPLDRSAYTLDQFLDELVAPSGVLRPVNVHKRRVRYTVGGCTSEVTEITAGGKTTRSIAIESENASGVVAAVASVGLACYLNTSYPRGLRALLDSVAAQLFRLALAIVLTLVTGAARALPIVNVPSTTDVCCFGDGTPYFAQSFLARGRFAEDLSFSISLLVT